MRRNDAEIDFQTFYISINFGYGPMLQMDVWSKDPILFGTKRE